ncbi:MAG TPA: ABC transporter permease [Candidatus Dormibacteraeota bacterium]
MSVAVAPALPMLVAQTRAQLLNYIRIPAFSLTSLALPLVFYTFFGLPNAGKHFPDGTSVGLYLMCSFGAYAVSSVMVFSFGIGVANQRGLKLDLLQRATPLPPAVAILAQVIMAALFAVVALVVLMLYVVVVGGVRFPVQTGLEIIGLLLVGALPLIGMGMAIGYASGPNAAPAIANLIYLPMAFASGMFVPVGDLPDFIQKIAKYLPTYHYAQLAYTPVHHADEALQWALLWSAVWTVILFAAAIRAYRRDALRKFS